MSSADGSKAPQQVHFPLLENGLDFIWSAVEHLSAGTSKRELKYALLHLVSGIELVLKERLRREDWKLLFPKPEAATKAAYKTGAFKSVDFGTLIERVEGYCFDGDWEAAESLRALRAQRNHFEHFAATESAEAVIASTAAALGVILDFIRTELSGDNDEFSEAESALLNDIRGKLTELDAFVEARLKSIAPALKEAYAVMPCPSCYEDALTIDDGVECLFCGYGADGEAAANAYVANSMGINRFRFEKDGGVWPVGFCPDCDWQACVDADDRGYLCFACGSRWEQGSFAECGHCGRWIDRDKSDIFVCDSCFEEQVRKSD